MNRIAVNWCMAVAIAVEFLAPVAVRAEPARDCPGSSYAPCHYNFPLLWNLCGRHAFRRQAAMEAPPPFSVNYYEYRSHCPYVAPAALLGFPSMTERARLASDTSTGR
jgi:hypothetical protein